MPSKRKLGRRTNHPPEGETWVWHTMGLLASPAWRGQSINCRRLIDFLELEHLSHGGNENGSLVAPYSQLVQAGISRRLIKGVIAEAEARGLISCEKGARRGLAMSDLSRYRLTYFWTKQRVNGLWDWLLPTDNWKIWEDDSAINKQRKTQTPGQIGSTSGTATVPRQVPSSVPLQALPPAQVIVTNRTTLVPEVVPPSISWGGEQGLTVKLGAGAARQAASAQRPLPDESYGLKPLRDIIDLSKLAPSKNRPVSRAA